MIKINIDIKKENIISDGWMTCSNWLNHNIAHMTDNNINICLYYANVDSNNHNMLAFKDYNIPYSDFSGQQLFFLNEQKNLELLDRVYKYILNGKLNNKSYSSTLEIGKEYNITFMLMSNNKEIRENIEFKITL